MKTHRSEQQERFGTSNDCFPNIHFPDVQEPTLDTGPLKREYQGIDALTRQRSHKWLEEMYKFSQVYYGLSIELLGPPDMDAAAREDIAVTAHEKPGENLKDSKDYLKTLPKTLRSPIKVALIDDGVRMYHEDLRGRIIPGASFDQTNELSDLPGAARPFHESQTGHGTHMATLICSVCPTAKIFPCRLNVLPGDSGAAHFTAKSAAEVRLSLFLLPPYIGTLSSGMHLYMQTGQSGIIGGNEREDLGTCKHRR